MDSNTFWFDLTVSMLRMDPIGPLFAAMLRPAITSCVSLTALHAVQRGLLDVLTSIYATEFPPRPAYINSLLKLVVAACEERGREVERTAEADENEEGLEFVNEDLLELYLDSGCLQSPGESIDKNEANTFFSSLLTFPMGSSSRGMASPAPLGLSFLSDAGTMGRFVPMRVTSAFVNVGLAVWPAAHVAIDLLSALVEGQPCAGLASHFSSAKGLYSALEGLQELAQADRLRVLELGAGVGLTPAVLHKRYQHATDRPPHITIAVTDYQPNILDNCAFNLQKCGCPYAQFADSTSFAASSPLVQPCGNADAIVVPLDWNERTETQRLISAFRPSIAIAADCIYDRCVLEGLSLTLKEALLGGSCCLGIIIQTHRNDATQTELHNLLGAFAHVFSYWYDANERRLVPLEDSATGSPSASWHAGTKACASPNPGDCIPLQSTGDYRVEMSEIMFIHFLWPKE